MVFQKILKILMAHPRLGPQIVNKLAESRPIKWAAKLTASAYLTGRHAIEQQIKDPKISRQVGDSYINEVGKNVKLGRFKETLTTELKKEWEKAKKGGKTNT